MEYCLFCGTSYEEEEIKLKKVLADEIEGLEPEELRLLNEKLKYFKVVKGQN